MSGRGDVSIQINNALARVRACTDHSADRVMSEFIDALGDMNPHGWKDYTKGVLGERFALIARDELDLLRKAKRDAVAMLKHLEGLSAALSTPPPKPTDEEA